MLAGYLESSSGSSILASAVALLTNKLAVYINSFVLAHTGTERSTASRERGSTQTAHARKAAIFVMFILRVNSGP